MLTLENDFLEGALTKGRDEDCELHTCERMAAIRAGRRQLRLRTVINLTMMELLAKGSSPRSANLVFTSAGDHSNVRRWLKGRRHFDLWVVYYGDTRGTLRNYADFYLCRKGSKFQNLHYCYGRWADIFDRYDAIMVIDDDIRIDATGLTRLFKMREELDLWVLQPACRPVGKISWDITRARPATRIRYTNFVEMACPLFRKDRLDAFMAVYDPQLVGFGIDWWFLHTMGPDLAGRVAIVDEITCVNPLDRSKGGQREIDRLQSKQVRQATWEQIRTSHGIVANEHREYGRLPRPALQAIAAHLAQFRDRAHVCLRGLGGSIVRAVLSRTS